MVYQVVRKEALVEKQAAVAKENKKREWEQQKRLRKNKAAERRAVQAKQHQTLKKIGEFELRLATAERQKRREIARGIREKQQAGVERDAKLMQGEAHAEAAIAITMGLIGVKQAKVDDALRRKRLQVIHCLLIAFPLHSLRQAFPCDAAAGGDDGGEPAGAAGPA